MTEADQLVCLELVAIQASRQVLCLEDHGREKHFSSRLANVGLGISHRSIKQQVRTHFENGRVLAMRVVNLVHTGPVVVALRRILLLDQVRDQVVILGVDVLPDVVAVEGDLGLSLVNGRLAFFCHYNFVTS